MLLYYPLLWSGVALSARCAKTVPTAASFLSSQSACRRLLLQSPAFLFSRLKFDFPRFGCRLYGPFENAPIPQEVKGYADGDSLRQLFSFSGLTFTRMRGIVRYILSETGVGPVPILPVVSHMFPPAFLSSQAHWESLGL